MGKLQKRFLEMYHPHCENAIDEAMIPFQVRSSLKQYMPAKPVKRRIKVWCRADSHNGYMCETLVYTGRAESAESGLGKRIVLGLSESLAGKNHLIYSPLCFSSLLCLKRGCMAAGLHAKITKIFLQLSK